MKHHNTTFFQMDDDECPQVSIKGPDKDDTWEMTVDIGILYDSPQVTIFLRNESDLYNFINSAKFALRNYRREQGYDR